MARFLGYKHLRGNRVKAGTLRVPASVVADYVARVDILLKGGCAKEDEKRTRRHELDALALCAIVDGANLEPTQKQQLYHIIRKGFIRAYGGDEVAAIRNAMDQRPYLMELRQVFSIRGDGGATSDEGTVAEEIAITYKTVADRDSVPRPAARAAKDDFGKERSFGANDLRFGPL